MVKPWTGGVQTHFEVVVALHPADGMIATLDPARGLCRNSLGGFLAEWEPSNRLALVAFEVAEEAGSNRGTPREEEK